MKLKYAFRKENFGHSHAQVRAEDPYEHVILIALQRLF
jgi:hypothetical protein